MSKYLNPRIELQTTILFVATFVGAGYVLPKQVRCTDYSMTALRLMHVFYPDLAGKSVTLESSAHFPFDSDAPPASFSITVSDLRPTEPITAAPYPAHLSSAESVGHLTTHFEFDGRDGQILWMSANGSFVNSQKYQDLIKRADENPGWTEEQIAEALAVAGTQFGPGEKEKVLAKIPARQLDSILGKVEISSAQFEYHDRSGPVVHAALQWTVRFYATKGSETEEYFLRMEPVEGKVVMFGAAWSPHGR